jgi:ribonuclease R
VPEGSALDAEAFSRATSTYLVDRVIPMLPEALSNGVCSLRSREDKLAYSCLLVVDGAGAVRSYEVCETVIHSAHRFTYDGAQEVLDGADHPLAEEVRRAGALARTLTARRLREGAIDFDVPEVRVVLDDAGQPVDIVHRERREANRLVEEFMLLANRAVAQEASRRQKPLMYRIHDAPDGERIAALAEYVQPFGYELALSGGTVPRSALNDLLRAVKGSPEAPVIEQAAIRSMAKAVYSPHNIGHYGLGFEHYAHFTSPIRRYPDLVVHRILKRVLGERTGPIPTTEALEVQAQHCSDREREAAEAERESVKLKQVEYAAMHVGDAFDGVVVGVTKFGVFVEMTALLTQGLVHVREMTDEYWEYDPARYALVGRSSRRRIRVGDPCRVRIVAAVPETRRVDLLFEDAPGHVADPRQVRAAKAKARRKHKERRRR